MQWNQTFSIAAIIAALAGAAAAQPAITSLGAGVPLTVTNPIAGTYYIGGAGLVTAGSARWTLAGDTLTAVDIGGGGSGGGYMSLDAQYLTGSLVNTNPSIFGNTASSVTPAFNPNPTLVPSTTLPATTEFAGRRWSVASNSWQSLGGLPIVPSLICYGSSSSGGSTSSFLTPNGISSDGRFVVGLGYVCTYNNAGNAVSANTFRWRPWIWDAQGNGGLGSMTVLPTPFKTTAGQTSLRRTGNAYAVSTDGRVIAGATEHNVGTTPAPDADGGRLVVWRWNETTSSYDMTYLNTGFDGSGFPKYQSSTPGSMVMNAAGTIIAARGPDGITKWAWDGSSWGSPIVLGSNLTTQASWLPGSVTSCGVPPSLGASLAMTENGNTIVGAAVYSTCGSFMSGGFIWTADDGVIRDWYDYNVALNTPGVAPGGVYGPIGDGGDITRGLPALGYPTAISPDGSAVAGAQGGTQRIVGAQPWIIRMNGGGCSAPVISSNPAASTAFSACTSSIILNVAAFGSPPFSYQWYKDGSPLSDGTTVGGSTITGALSFQLRVNSPLTPADAGTYYAVVTGQCGSAVQSTNALVSLDPAFPAAANDTCATAQAVAMGTNVLGAGQSPCGAYINDPITYDSCLPTAPKTDRWFVFTPSAAGNYRFETCGANYDTVLTAYNGCNGSELDCNNDYTIGPSTGCSSQRSRIASLHLEANEACYLRIAAPASAFLSSTSLMNLSISNAPAPAANDTCQTAAVAVIGANAFDTTEATNDSFASCNTVASRDVWFRFTPTGRGTLRAATCPGTTWNTVLSMYEGCGNEIACNDNAGTTGCSSQSVISGIPVREGTDYYFRIGGNSLTAFGTGTLTLDFLCSADFNQDGGVDGSDVEAFFGSWESGAAAADINLDGGTDGGDVEAFFTIWENGGC